MPVMFGSNGGESLNRGMSALGDAFLGYLGQQAKEPLLNAQALKMRSDIDTNVAQQGKLGQETQILQNKALWQAEGMNLPNMSPDQQMQWALRGHSIGEDPQRFVKGLASGEFMRAAQPGAQAMPEDRSRNLGMAMGHFATDNSAYTVPYQQKVIGDKNAQQVKLANIHEGGANYRSDSALDKAIVPVIGPDGTPQYATRREAIGKAPAQVGGGRPLPPQAAAAISNNAQSISKIDRAIENIDKNPNAVGFMKGVASKFDSTRAVLDSNDPNGIDARADIADIGSLILHDRSGAAVTVSEAPRLVPFIPTPTDSAQTAKKKLERLREMALMDTETLSAMYTPENGYRPVTMPGTRQQQPAHTKGAAPTRPGGKISIDANGNIIGGR